MFLDQYYSIPTSILTAVNIVTKIVQLFSQSITPNLSMGSEIFWLGHQRKSGIGFAARYNTDKMVSSNSCIYQYLVKAFRYLASCLKYCEHIILRFIV